MSFRYTSLKNIKILTHPKLLNGSVHIYLNFLGVLHFKKIQKDLSSHSKFAQNEL